MPEYEQPGKGPTEMEQYLNDVTRICREILQDNLVGIYAQGSIALDDFQDGLSDFDLMTVVKRPLPVEQSRQLAEALDHSRTPVPAEGMEMVVVTERAARKLKPCPRYEMWMYTGAEWPEVELELGKYDCELLIFYSIVLQCGKTLFGPPPTEVFSKPPREWVLKTMAEVLEFYMERQMDSWWDPMGRNSVLNACRTWRYAETGSFSSKGLGGEWVLSREHWQPVLDALQNRQVDPAEGRAFVEHVLSSLRQPEKKTLAS
jgi:hypothetical protein